MTYVDDTGRKQHATGYVLEFDGVPSALATHSFPQMVEPTTSNAWAWWPLSEQSASDFAADAFGVYNLSNGGTGTPEPSGSFLQPDGLAYGSRYFTGDYDIRFVNQITIAEAVALRGSVSAGFRPAALTGIETIFSYAGTLFSLSENAVIELRTNGTELEVFWSDAATSNVVSTTSGLGLEVGKAYHAMATWQPNGAGTDLYVYVWRPGVGLIHTQSFTGLNRAAGGSGADFIIGSNRAASGTQLYSGFLEDIVLWRKYHSADEAAAYLRFFSSTFIPCLPSGAVSAAGASLDRPRSLIVPGGFSAQVIDQPSVRGLFSRRGGLQSELVFSIDESATTLETVATPFAQGQTVYTEKETVILGPLSAGQYTLSDRGARGTTAVPHGATMTVSSQPRHWLGRRATLTAVYLDTLNAEPLRAGIVASSPQYSRGMWDLDFLDIQSQLNRPLLRGFQAEKSADWSVSGSTIVVTVTDDRNFADGANAFVRVTANGVDGTGDLFRIHRLAAGAVDRVAGTVTLDLLDVVYDANPSVQIDVGTELEIMQVAVITCDAATAALQAMISQFGDGTADADYDLLPGVRPSLTSTTADLAPRQIGAGLPLQWVDVPAWEGMTSSGGICTFVIDEETRLLDFLVNEISWRLGGYVYVTRQGKISFQRYRAGAATLDVDQLDQSEILAGAVSVVDDESEIISRASIESNYSLATREYQLKQTVVFADLAGTYSDGLPVVELKPKSLWVGTGGGPLTSAPSSQWEIIGQLDRMYARTKNGVRKVRLRLPWSKHIQYQPGTVFTLSDDRLPDLESDGLGVSGQYYEVTSSNPDTQTGTVEIEAEEMPRGYIIAPSCIVQSYAAGVITIDATTANLFDANPGFDFPGVCDIEVFSASATPPFSTSQLGIVSAVTSSTLVTGGFGTAPASGDLVVLRYDVPYTGNPAQNTGAEVSDHAFQVDAAGTIGTPAVDGSKLA